MRQIGWKDEEKLKPYNNTKAIVVDISQISVKYGITARIFFSPDSVETQREIVYTKRDGIVNIKWGVELKTGKTVKLSRDKMVVMREPLTPTQMKELHEKVKKNEMSALVQFLVRDKLMGAYIVLC